MSNITDPEAGEKRLAEMIRVELERVRGQLDEAKALRITAAVLGREVGLTNQRIGEALGVTEARVRQLLAAK